MRHFVLSHWNANPIFIIQTLHLVLILFPSFLREKRKKQIKEELGLSTIDRAAKVSVTFFYLLEASG